MQAKPTFVTCAEMKEIEKKAAENGLSYYQMMENAGTGAAEFIMNQSASQGKSVLIFCGKGNNGGDGFVVARILYEKGYKVKLVLVDGDPQTEDAIKNREICKSIQIPEIIVTEGEPDWQTTESASGHYHRCDLRYRLSRRIKG
jgi:hydroxyethylthiazole kinase-like uncharacterized protein yjeF